VRASGPRSGVRVHVRVGNERQVGERAARQRRVAQDPLGELVPPDELDVRVAQRHLDERAQRLEPARPAGDERVQRQREQAPTRWPANTARFAVSPETLRMRSRHARAVARRAVVRRAAGAATVRAR